MVLYDSLEGEIDSDVITKNLKHLFIISSFEDHTLILPEF
jgi:hypothetical protein